MNSPLHKLASFLYEILTICESFSLKTVVSYGANNSIGNSFKLVDNIKKLKIPNENTFLSLDASLYTNIPIDLWHIRIALVRNWVRTFSVVHSVVRMLYQCVQVVVFDKWRLTQCSAEFVFGLTEWTEWTERIQEMLH